MENNVSEKELKELVSEGIDIRELARLARQLKEQGTAEVKPKAKRATPSKPEYTWKVTLCKYPDFVISKWTNGKNEKQLVIMPSCKGYYIKNVDTGEITALTPEAYSRFTASMEQVDLPKKDEKDVDMWISNIKPGVRYFRSLNTALNDETYCTMLKLGIAPHFDVLRWNYEHTRIIDDRLFIFNKIGKLYTDYIKNHKDSRVTSMIINSSCTTFLNDMVNTYGMDNTRDFLDALENSLISSYQGDSYSSGDSLARSFADISRWNTPATTIVDDQYKNSPRPRFTMKYSAFKNYVLYQAVREGYALSLRSFFQTWSDTLTMQIQYYGKIKEKYPTNLAAYHQQLSYKVMLNKQRIDAMAFDRQYKKTCKYQMVVDGYAFIAPESAKSFYEAATFLCNCLASYVGKYTEGRTHILFMQKIDNPHELVAIEYLNGHINQAYQAHNVRVTQEQQAVIDKWYEQVKKIDDGKISNEQCEKLSKPVVDMIEKWKEATGKKDVKAANA